MPQLGIRVYEWATLGERGSKLIVKKLELRINAPWEKDGPSDEEVYKIISPYIQADECIVIRHVTS